MKEIKFKETIVRVNNIEFLKGKFVDEKEAEFIKKTYDLNSYKIDCKNIILINYPYKIGNIQTNKKKMNLFLNDWNKIIENINDIQTIYFELIRLIYNSFITNHIMIDGNKRMYKFYTQELNNITDWKELY